MAALCPGATTDARRVYRLHEIDVKYGGNRLPLPRQSMTLYLLNLAVDRTLELYVATEAEEAMNIQWDRIKDRNVRDTFVRRLEVNFERALKESLDWDLKEPTPAQLAYAELIAKKRGISVPSEARRYRFHTAMFIETYADPVNVKESRPSNSNFTQD